MHDLREETPIISDSGDYTWRPEYVRRSIDSLRPRYGIPTSGDHIAALEQRIAALEAIVQRYITNTEGTL